MASQTPRMIFSIRSGQDCQMSRSKVRVVPLSSTVSGMMLKELPPLKLPTVTTEGLRGFICRLTIRCSALTT